MTTEIISTTKQNKQGYCEFIAGQQVKNLSISFFNSEARDKIGFSSSLIIVESKSKDCTISILDCITHIKYSGSKKLNVKSKKCIISDDSYILEFEGLIPEGECHICLNNTKARIVKIPIRNAEIKIFDVDENSLIHNSYVSVEPGPLHSVLTSMPSTATACQPVCAIIKYVDEHGNITKIKKDKKDLDYLSVKICPTTENSEFSESIKKTIIEPKRGIVALTGIQSNSEGNFVVRIFSKHEQVSSSSVFSVFGHGNKNGKKAVHWNIIHRIKNMEIAQSVVNSLFPVHTNLSIAPLIPESNEGYDQSPLAAQIPVNHCLDMILTQSDVNPKISTIKIQAHAQNLHNYGTVLPMPYPGPICPTKRILSKYTSIGTVHEYTSDKIQYDSSIKFIDIGIKKRQKVSEVIKRIKIAHSSLHKKSLSLLSTSNEFTPLKEEVKNSIISNHNHLKGELNSVIGMQNGSTYISTGEEDVVFATLFDYSPSFNNIEIEENPGYKYTRHFSLFVSAKNEIKSVYLIKNDVIIHTINPKEDEKLTLDYSYNDTNIISEYTRYYWIIEHDNGHILVTSNMSLNPSQKK